MAAKKKKSHVLGSLRHSTNLPHSSACATQFAPSSTYCSFLKCLFSTPAWFTLIRSIATTRSSAVRNHAFAGESGKKNLRPTRRSFLLDRQANSAGHVPEYDRDHERNNPGDDHQPVGFNHVREEWSFAGLRTHHCHGSSTSCWMCSVPYATRPSMMIAAPFMRTASRFARLSGVAESTEGDTHTSSRPAASAPDACRTWTSRS